MTISLVAVLGLTANAQMFSNSQQTDGFFTTETPGGNYRDGSAGEGISFPGLPGMGVYEDQAAPVGSGLLLLAGMGAAYAIRRKNRK